MPNPLDSQYLNVEGARQLVSASLNKVVSTDLPHEEGVSDDTFDELELSMSDEELLSLSRQWLIDSKDYNEKIKTRQDTNKAYVLGRQSNALGNDKVIADNLLFEAITTFIPAALAKNPEPVVFTDNTPEGIALSKDVKTVLQYLADELVLREQLKKTVLHEQIYFIGALRHFWNPQKNEIDLRVVLPQNLIFSEHGTIDEVGDYDGRFLGELHTKTAQEVVDMFPKKEMEITLAVAGKMGTNITYTEWSTPLYCFYTFKDIVLGKYKNSNWNYDHKVGTGEYEEEKEIVEIVPGRNHFAYPKIPYTFFSTFNLGLHPHSDTTLIEQNIPNQDVVTNRNTQISYNLENANNGLVFSGEFFNKEDAKEGNSAVRRGVGIYQPSGDVRAGVTRLPAPALPNGLFEEVQRRETVLRSIFGTQSISSGAGQQEKTVRGKILNQQNDTTRIGGGIGDKIAQVADNIFNHQVQMMYVYYDEPHWASIIGQAAAVQNVMLQRSDLMAGEHHRKLIVSVSPDSMKPKDELTQMNLATDMWNAQALDPLSYYEMLNLPDPQKLVERLVAWKTNPIALVQGMGQMQGQPVPEGGPQEAEGEQDVPPAEPESLSADPASASLSQVPINNQTVAMPS